MAVALSNPRQTKTLCDLCGLPAPVPLSAEIGGQSHTFCCSGCRQVYQILIESDQISAGQDPTQTTLYQQCLQMGLIARPEEAPTPHPSPASGRGESDEESEGEGQLFGPSLSDPPLPLAGEGRGVGASSGLAISPICKHCW